MKKYIVITGSTSGIGKALLELFANDEKYFIFAGYRNSEKITFQKENLEYFYLNLEDSKSILDASNYIKSKTNKIDILINVAGGVVAGPIEIINIENLKKQFVINTFSHLEFTQNLISTLENSRIINISSMSSFGHFPFISPYCASKRSLDILFNALSIENHKNIDIVSIKPGVISTPIWEKSIENNKKLIENCQEYEIEMEFLKNNALKSKTKGLDVKKVAKKIIKIATQKKVKSSYLIGKDAILAHFISYLPQDIINLIIKFGLKYRLNEFIKNNNFTH